MITGESNISSNFFASIIHESIHPPIQQMAHITKKFCIKRKSGNKVGKYPLETGSAILMHNTSKELKIPCVIKCFILLREKIVLSGKCIKRALHMSTYGIILVLNYSNIQGGKISLAQPPSTYFIILLNSTV